jgi:hypothetical protein
MDKQTAARVHPGNLRLRIACYWSLVNVSGSAITSPRDVAQITRRIGASPYSGTATTAGVSNPRRFAMMRLIVAAFLAVALFAATTVLRSHSISNNDAAKLAMMPSVQELQHATDTSKLPAEVADDRSVVYPQQPSR